MWDLIVSVPDHCFSCYIVNVGTPFNEEGKNVIGQNKLSISSLLSFISP